MSFSSYRSGGSLLGLRSMKSGAYLSRKSSVLLKLKSGSVLSGRLSSKSGSSISRSYTKSKVSELLKSDVLDVSGVSNKANSGLTKDYVSKLEAQAKADAGAGTYGKDGKSDKLRDEQMKKYVSPDRDAAIAQASRLLTRVSAASTKTKLTGLPYTVSISKGRSGTTAELYDEYGEKFASYDSKSGQWKSVTTKAESQFQTASSSIYDEAYRAAATGKNSSINKNTSSGLDVRV